MLSFNVAAASALIPSVAKSFMTDEFLAGRIVWLYMLPYGAAALLYGPLARSVNCKKILLWCVFVFSIANFISGFAPRISILFIGRVLSGVSGAAIVPLSLIMIAKTSVANVRGKTVGGFFSITFISSLLGLFLSGLLHWRWIFLIPAISAVLVFCGIYRFFPDSLTERRKISFNYMQAFSDQRVLRLFIYIFFISFLYHGVRQWLGVYFFKIYGFEQFIISMLLTTISLSGILGESLGGMLADKVGRGKVINAGVVMMLFAIVALLVRNVALGLFIIMFIWGLGWTFNHAGLSTFLCDLPHEYLYESASLNSSVRFLSGGLGMVFGGLLSRWDFNLQFMFFGFCLVALLIFSRKLIKEIPRPVGSG